LSRGAASKDHPDGFFKLTENVRCEDGNQALAEKLAESIRTQGGSIELAHPVKKIELHESKTVVTAAGRRRIHADYIVLAVPPGAWGRIVIDPPRPELFHINGNGRQILDTIRYALLV